MHRFFLVGATVRRRKTRLAYRVANFGQMAQVKRACPSPLQNEAVAEVEAPLTPGSVVPA